MENNDLCAITPWQPKLDLVLQCHSFVSFWRNEAACQCTSHLVQDRGLCIRLSITIHYKIFPVFKRILVMLLYEKILWP